MAALTEQRKQSGNATETRCKCSSSCTGTAVNSKPKGWNGYMKRLRTSAAADFGDKSTKTETTEEMTNVSFQNKVKVRFIESHREYTEEEVRRTWYQDEDYNRITRDCCKQIQKSEVGKVLKADKYCSRGLESHTRLGSLCKKQNRRNGFEAVLREQNEQFQLGVVDDEAIACVYHNVTSSCQLWASAIGLRDQRAAAEYID